MDLKRLNDSMEEAVNFVAAMIIVVMGGTFAIACIVAIGYVLFGGLQ
jgi:hypothetical protein